MQFKRLFERPLARYRCHGNPFLCCQYTDLPTCNSTRETHLYGRHVWNVNARREARS